MGVARYGLQAYGILHFYCKGYWFQRDWLFSVILFHLMSWFTSISLRLEMLFCCVKPPLHSPREKSEGLEPRNCLTGVDPKLVENMAPSGCVNDRWIHNVPINSKVQHPPRGNPPGMWTFEDWLVQIPFPRGKRAVQMPHQLGLNYLSSKTNFVFNQTLYTPFRERYAVMTPSNFF